MSGASAANCAAVGLYAGRGGLLQMFAVSQRHGRWSKAIEVPGLGALWSARGLSPQGPVCGGCEE